MNDYDSYEDAKIKFFLEQLHQYDRCSDYDHAIEDGATPEQAGEYEVWAEQNVDIHQNDCNFKSWIEGDYAILKYEIDLAEQYESTQGTTP